MNLLSQQIMRSEVANKKGCGQSKGRGLIKFARTYTTAPSLSKILDTPLPPCIQCHVPSNNEKIMEYLVRENEIVTFRSTVKTD